MLPAAAKVYDGGMGSETQLPGPERRIAFFGGSFDPPHAGHLAIARAARDLLALDEVLFVPVGRQPLKSGLGASYEDRCQMTRLAVAEEPKLSISLLDAPRNDATPNFTAETLEALRRTLPPAGRLFCLIGADSFLALNRWHRSAEIPFLAELIVASRPGEPLEPLEAHMPSGLKLVSNQPEKPHNDSWHQWQIADKAGRVARLNILPNLHYEVSATELRAAIQTGISQVQTGGQPISPAVLAYICSHRLYA